MRQLRLRHSFVLTGAFMLGGCMAVPYDVADEMQPRARWLGEHCPIDSAEAEISALASFAETLSLLSPASQRQELDAAERDYEREGTAVRRLRLALLLSLADEELRELDRAHELLTAAPEGPERVAHIGLRRLLALLVAELQAEQPEQPEQPVQAEREEQRQHALDALLAAERARCDALEEQLDRLKDIERQINERSRSPTLQMDDDNEPTENPAGR
jgi:hypothetical protein